VRGVYIQCIHLSWKSTDYKNCSTKSYSSQVWSGQQKQR